MAIEGPGGDRSTSTRQWEGACRSRFAWPLVIGGGAGAVVATVVAVATGNGVAAFVAVISLVVALAGYPFIVIGVTVDRRGLRVAYGPLGWPVTTIALDDVASARLEADAEPMRWGGWGYRGSRVLAKRAAVVLRRGPAIRVDLRSGAVFLVTVDDAAAGARVLNDLVGVAPAGGAS